MPRKVNLVQSISPVKKEGVKHDKNQNLKQFQSEVKQKKIEYTGYFSFYTQRKEQLFKSNKNLSAVDISKLIVNEWEKYSLEQKGQFNDPAFKIQDLQQQKGRWNSLEKKQNFSNLEEKRIDELEKKIIQNIPGGVSENQKNNKNQSSSKEEFVERGRNTRSAQQMNLKDFMVQRVAKSDVKNQKLEKQEEDLKEELRKRKQIKQESQSLQQSEVKENQQNKSNKQNKSPSVDQKIQKENRFTPQNSSQSEKSLKKTQILDLEVLPTTQEKKKNLMNFPNTPAIQKKKTSLQKNKLNKLSEQLDLGESEENEPQSQKQEKQESQSKQNSKKSEKINKNDKIEQEEEEKIKQRGRKTEKIDKNDKIELEEEEKIKSKGKKIEKILETELIEKNLIDQNQKDVEKKQNENQPKIDSKPNPNKKTNLRQRKFNEKDIEIEEEIVEIDKKLDQQIKKGENIQNQAIQKEQNQIQGQNLNVITPAKNSEYIEFFKKVYQQLKERFPKRNSRELSQAASLEWKRFKMMKKGVQVRQQMDRKIIKEKVQRINGEIVTIPNKPISSFFIYFKEQREILLEQENNKEIKLLDLTREISQAWRELDEQSKQKYQKQSIELKQQYELQIKQLKEQYGQEFEDIIAAQRKKSNLKRKQEKDQNKSQEPRIKKQIVREKKIKEKTLKQKTEPKRPKLFEALETEYQTQF